MVPSGVPAQGDSASRQDHHCSERGSPEVLIAAELLTNAAEHGDPVEFARIAILQALMLGQHVLGDIHRAAIAHHGWGVYDTSKSFTVTGTILSQTP
jgi:hypothetical protein